LTEVIDEHELAYFQNAKALWKGSLRTPLGFHLANALSEIRAEHPELLKSGGGHALAAGVALEFENISIFKEAFEKKISAQPQQIRETVVDADLEKFSEAEDVLSLLEPFGAGNPPPLVKVKKFSILQTRVMKDQHLKFWGDLNGEKGSVLHFKSPWVRMFAGLEREPKEIDLIAELSENEWRGNKTLELMMKELVELRIRGVKRVVERPSEQNANETGQRTGL
jgi:single-stranded-DNA-specific exonuclease